MEGPQFTQAHWSGISSAADLSSGWFVHQGLGRSVCVGILPLSAGNLLDQSTTPALCTWFTSGRSPPYSRLEQKGKVIKLKTLSIKSYCRMCRTRAGRAWQWKRVQPQNPTDSVASGSRQAIRGAGRLQGWSIVSLGGHPQSSGHGPVVR